MTKILVIIAVIIFGTLLHYLYQISKENKLVALISAVNESVWEHLKLSFFSIIIIGIFEYLLFKNETNNFWTSKMIASIFAMSFTIITFYTYYGIIGKDNLFLDISIFIIGIVVSEILSYKVMQSTNLNIEFYSKIILLIISLFFGIFTFNPPRIPLFQDPVTKKYGIKIDNR